ncbi:MAG: 4-alpha-glucanotransferase [Planctomycetota bacterium]|jgi:4-alpha-glucanotransferase|nr:4-alpha-glucanotransferase [Planctomycetota bacterium]
MAFPRLAGMILHPTSLPGGQGIGDLGDAAYAFVDFLEKAGIGIWQVLPLGPTSGADSPYQSLSSFAGNPLLISLERLTAERLVDPADLESAPENADRVDFAAVAAYKDRLLHKAMESFEDGCSSVQFAKDFERFAEEEREWLDDFALFAAAKTFFNGQPWFEWKDIDLRLHRPEASRKYAKLLAGDVRREKFLQFLFFRQWRELRSYAAARNIRFLGDVPIYCAHDSADVWAAPENFQLDENGGAELMAGVPPDYFAATGQLWGNPLYNWKALEETGYSWWLSRIDATLSLVDMLRIDHFRGFEAFWAVPKGETTAINGKWIKGPGQKFFDALKKKLGDNLPILAEDLGVITPGVDKLRLDNGLPGMKVLHFAFGVGAEAYLPHTYEPNCVCYVATHDNDTTRGWYDADSGDYAHMSKEVIEFERDRARRYLGRDGSSMPWDLMRLALGSVADTAVLLMQDVLNLPNSARMNRPGLGEGQWGWRLTSEQLADASWGGIRDMVELYGRLPVKPGKEPAEDVEAVEEFEEIGARANGDDIAVQ